jgi:hypothetical protein
MNLSVVIPFFCGTTRTFGCNRLIAVVQAIFNQGGCLHSTRIGFLFSWLTDLMQPL